MIRKRMACPRPRKNSHVLIPRDGQGLEAKVRQRGTEGGKEWLKHLKLHKYWPTFSQWSYEEFMSLNEGNIELRIAETGSSGLTYGAKAKLLRSIEMLRRREEDLYRIRTDLSEGRRVDREVLLYMTSVVNTPVPRHPRSNVAVAIVKTVLKVHAVVTQSGEFEECLLGKVNSLLQKIEQRPVLSKTLCNIRKRPEETDQEDARTISVKSISTSISSTADDSGLGDLTLNTSSDFPITENQALSSPYHSTPVKLPLRTNMRRESVSSTSSNSSVYLEKNILNNYASFGNISPVCKNNLSHSSNQAQPTSRKTPARLLYSESESGRNDKPGSSETAKLMPSQSQRSTPEGINVRSTTPSSIVPDHITDRNKVLVTTGYIFVPYYAPRIPNNNVTDIPNNHSGYNYSYTYNNGPQGINRTGILSALNRQPESDNCQNSMQQNMNTMDSNYLYSNDLIMNNGIECQMQEEALKCLSNLATQIAEFVLK